MSVVSPLNTGWGGGGDAIPADSLQVATCGDVEKLSITE